MIYHGLIITGTSGAGKTTLTRNLIESGAFEQVRAVITRQPRKDDAGEYEYISSEEFQTRLKLNQLVINTQYRDQYYGISTSAVNAVKKKGKIPILVITPASCREYEMRKTKPFTFLSCFIDAEDGELDKRLIARDGEITDTVKDSRNKDRTFKDQCLYYIRNISVEKTSELIQNLWELRVSGGILSKRLIELMLSSNMLLTNANYDNVKSASYDLSLGDEYYYKGKIQRLNADNPFLVIEPYDYVIATSIELANFPRDISGRFDLAVSLFCQGVILSNGPCVDPGFRGRLFCLLFNTSNAPVHLKRGQHYATLELQKLIEPTIPYSGKYQDKQSIVDYLPSNALQGGINELKKEVESLKRGNQLLQTAIAGGIAILLAVLSVLLVIK